MSTRCNILFKDDQGSKIWVYRHSDGYPETTGKDLKEFCKGYTSKFRNDASQSAGWLIIHGSQNQVKRLGAYDPEMKASSESMYSWKVGDYEPTDQLHGDVEFIYVIDLKNMILETRVPKNFETFFDKPRLSNTKLINKHSIQGGAK